MTPPWRECYSLSILPDIPSQTLEGHFELKWHPRRALELASSVASRNLQSQGKLQVLWAWTLLPNFANCVFV